MSFAACYLERSKGQKMGRCYGLILYLIILFCLSSVAHKSGILSGLVLDPLDSYVMMSRRLQLEGITEFVPKRLGLSLPNHRAGRSP